MTQQFMALRERNDPLKELIGNSYNQKSKDEAERILKEIHSISSGQTLDKHVLCYATRDGEVKGVGGSSLLEDKLTGEIQSNLILDQFGIWLSGIFRTQGTAVESRTMRDTGNVLRTLQIYGNGVHFNETPGSSPGCDVIVGSGTTAPTRADFVTETVFLTAPENGAIALGVNSVYTNSTNIIKMQGSITAGGSGTINESNFRGVWQDNTGGFRAYTLYRDIISPGVPFISGDSIILEYTTQI